MNKYLIRIGKGDDYTFYLIKNGVKISNKNWVYQLLYEVAAHENVILQNCESESYMLSLLKDYGVSIKVEGL